MGHPVLAASFETSEMASDEEVPDVRRSGRRREVVPPGEHHRGQPALRPGEDGREELRPALVARYDHRRDVDMEPAMQHDRRVHGSNLMSPGPFALATRVRSE